MPGKSWISDSNVPPCSPPHVVFLSRITKFKAGSELPLEGIKLEPETPNNYKRYSNCRLTLKKTSQNPQKRKVTSYASSLDDTWALNDCRRGRGGWKEEYHILRYNSIKSILQPNPAQPKPNQMGTGTVCPS